MTSYRFLLAVSIVGVGCGASSSPDDHHGIPLTNAGKGGSMSAGTGGNVVTAGAGSGAHGGTTAVAGTGGSETSPAGKGTGAAGSTGMEPSGGRSGSGGTSGGTAGRGASSGAGGSGTAGGTSGTLGAGTGGAGEMTGGNSGMDGGQAGEGPSVPDTPTKVDDPDATGDGPCASKTARDVLDAIHEAYPEFADITEFYDPRYIGVAELVYPYKSDLGFSLVLARGKGDCPGGCSSWRYWYFQTDASCAPEQVGTFSAEVGPGNCYTVKGEPMWGMPAHTPMASDICPP